VPSPSPSPSPTPAPPTSREALEGGVLIVVSLPSQRMFVFKNGEPWNSSPVSTGRRGHDTPTGVFPILQKKVHHRSNLYDGAPMPYMQRLTWDGAALHAGAVPGYPASHGCIRLPRGFAKQLYSLTDFSATVVLIADTPLGSEEEARALGSGGLAALAVLQSARPRPLPAGSDRRGQTIQLAAAASPNHAIALWEQLVQRQPDLASLSHEVIPARVDSRTIYRLRASGPRAHSLCRELAHAQAPCWKINS
jgi:hypothetical protein